MNGRKLAPWIGWLLVGVLIVYIAMNRSRVAPTPPAPLPPSATPLPAATQAAEALPQPSVDPSIQAAIQALSIQSAEPSTPSAPVERPVVRTEGAPAPSPSASPTPTPAARGAVDAEAAKIAAMEPELEQMAENARKLSEGQAEYAKSCVGTSVVPYRDAYGSQVQGTLDKANLPECVSLKAEMTNTKSALEHKGAEIQDRARRTGVLPGVFRRLAEKYGLQLYLKP